MQVRAIFIRGPHDGLERMIDAPAPRAIAVLSDGVLADYFYAGFIDGAAYYGIEPVRAVAA